MGKDIPEVEIPAELRPVLAAAANNLATHLDGPQGPPWGTSFASLEELTVLIGGHLGAELLQQSLQRQASQPPPSPLQACPACAAPLAEQPPEPRSVRTTAGTADWQEPARYCRRCRRAFFPKSKSLGIDRVKGSAKFWCQQGAEAIVQLRADHLSDDAPLDEFWRQRQTTATGQRPYRRAG